MMKLIDWTDDLSVKIEVIDKQHYTLVEMINDLNEAMENRIGQETAGEIIESLVNYTETHFKTEEDLLKKNGFSEIDSHKQEHADFVKKVSEFRDDFNSGKIGLSIFIMDFLSSWLKNHIKGTDKKYSDFLNSRGVR